MKRKITMTIDGKVFSAFKKTCNDNAMKVSSKVELMMRDHVLNDGLNEIDLLTESVNGPQTKKNARRVAARTGRSR